MKSKTLEYLCTVLMIVLTCFVSFQCDLKTENWTVLLLRPEKYLLYLFGTLGSFLFCFLLYRFSVNVLHPLKKQCLLTALCMPLSLLFVFDPEFHPIQSSLHLLFSYLFFFCVNGCYIHSLFILSFSHKRKTDFLFQIYLIILALCAGLYLRFMSINTLFELCFTVSMTLLLSFSIRTTEKKHIQE
ncbi:MAG: hypothetical protein E7192_09110 [Erysipelotrichaceae bacterium]|nr:hypothetical protein [Erysipelotrichaceae bacterium]MBQ4343235.1 hypothetical protein [Erysipelotrichaceae bacterium]